MGYRSIEYLATILTNDKLELFLTAKNITKAQLKEYFISLLVFKFANEERFFTILDYHQLENIKVHPLNANFKSLDGVLISIDEKILYRMPPKNKNVSTFTLPESVEIISDYCFYKLSDMTIINFNEGLKTVSNFAFMETSISSLTFPNSLQEILESAFAGCNNINGLNFKNTNLTTIGTNGFAMTTLAPNTIVEHIMFPSSLISVGNTAFVNFQALRFVTFFGTTTIGVDAFKGVNSELIVARNYSLGNVITSAHTDASTISYINIDQYAVDILFLEDHYVPSHGYITPQDVIYSNFDGTNSKISELFTSSTDERFFSDGLKITNASFTINDADKQINITQSLTDNTIRLTDIDNLTNFNDNISAYGNNYLLIRYVRSLYIPTDKTKIRFTVSKSANDALIIILNNGSNIQYLDTTLELHTSKNYEMNIPESNRNYILSFIFYEYVFDNSLEISFVLLN